MVTSNSTRADHPWTLPERWDCADGTVRWGKMGDGPPLALLHGTPFSSFIWRDIAPVLAEEHTVYFWDMLGFGQSDKTSADLSLQRQTKIFGDLLRHWGAEEPRVIAHDVGGVVALRTALIHKVEFSGLTLINAASVSGWGAGAFFNAVSTDPEVFASLPGWASDSLIQAKIRSGSHTGLRPATLREYIDQWRSGDGRAAFYRQYAQGGEESTAPLQNLLASLSIPLHVIWGAQDQWLDLDYAHRLIAELPSHTRFSVIEQAGHMVPEDQPGALLAALLKGRHAF